MNGFLTCALVAGVIALLLWLFTSEEDGILPGGRAVLGAFIVTLLLGAGIMAGVAKLLGWW